MKMQTDFFLHLFKNCGGQIEIRLLPSCKQRYFSLDELDKLAKYVKDNSYQNIYFGVATRDGQGGGKENIINIPSVWCDADFKDIARKELHAKLKRFPFSPSIIISTGGGAHFYWLLKEPARKKDIIRVEEINRRIAQHVSGDANACDAARILRVPGTKNHKYSPPRSVNVTRSDSFHYVLDDFLEILPEVKKNQTGIKNKMKNSAGWLVEALKGAPYGHRNATGARIAGYFIDKLPQKDILTILIAWNYRNTPPLPDTEVKRIVRSISRYGNQSEAHNERKERVTVTFSRN